MSPRKRCHRKTAPSTMRLERLERRLPLAGNVTAELTGSTLRLTGDHLANDVMVASAAGGTIAVIGIDTTVNGRQAAFVTTEAVTSIVTKLKGGDDAVGFGNSAADYLSQRQLTSLATSPVVWSEDPPAPFDVAAVQARIDEVAGGATTFSIPGSLRVKTGDGNDAVGISGNVGGSIIVNLGSADAGNGLVIGSETLAGRVGAGITVNGGDRNDLVAIGNMSVAGTVSASLGDGINWMNVMGGDDAPTTIAALAYTGGVDEDGVGLMGDVTVRNNVRIFTGVRGEDEVDFFSNLRSAVFGGGVKVRGNVVVNTGTGSDGDTVRLVGNFRGDVSVTTGGGRDTVSVSSYVGWVSTDGSDPVPLVEVVGWSAIGLDLNINTGAGNDLISIGTSTVGRDATIHAESGDDDVRIDSMQVKRNLSVNLGAGNDSLAVMNLRAFAAFFYGGSGTNTLSTDAATRAGSRTLRKFQFQVVSNG
ncbi:MAG: hypothetical protein ACKO4T_00445 [Planctomycetaceae bacterium]